MTNNILTIWLWDREVGRIYWDAAAHRAVFEYSKDFISQGLDIAPLTASIHSPAAKRPIYGDRDKLYQGLPPFLADSLPDKWGDLVFEQWRTMHYPDQSITPVDRLAFIGSRGMGALEFRPAVPIEQLPDELMLTEIYRLSQQILEQRTQLQVLAQEPLTLQTLYAIGTSAGGQHPKALIAIHRETGDIRSGQVDWGNDYDYYILKFAEQQDFPYTQVEMAYYLMARAAGIDMMPSRLIEIDGRQHFLTQRFDRQDGKRIHVQTLAAMSTIADSYEDLMTVARRLQVPPSEQEQLFLRIVFNCLAGNIDDHTKNFAFMLSTDGSWHLTPAYDLTFTTDIDGPAYRNRHELSLLGKTDHITPDDLLRFAEANSIKRPTHLLHQVSSALTQWPTYAHQASVPTLWLTRINTFLQNPIEL